MEPSRLDSIIKKKYCAIFSFFGLICIFSGLLLLVPLLTLFFYPDETVNTSAFIIPSIFSLVFGIVLWLSFKRRESSSLTLQDGAVVVILSWGYVCLISSIPFLIESQLVPIKALFESVSGWTTTGLSVIDVSETSKPILLWRSILQFSGGGGLAIIMLSAIIGPYGAGLYQAEGHTDQLLPNISSSAKMVMTIYSIYTFLGIIAYIIAGMPVFDAINHSFCALSTGGFSTVTDSIGHWHNLSIEVITIILMLLGTTSFTTHYLLLRFKFKEVLRTGELRLLIVVLAVTVPVVLYLVTMMTYVNFSDSLRVAIFQVVSALSTTGYSTVEFKDWSSLGIFILVLLMIIGGGTCSTAGGIKQYRVYLLIKSLFWSMRDHFLPKSVVVKDYIWRGENKLYIDDSHVRQVANFAFLYIITFVVGVLIFLASGYPLKESLFEFASALGTVGLSSGITNANTPHLILWTEMFGMFLGRLEFLVIFFGIVKVCRDVETVISMKKK